MSTSLQGYEALQRRFAALGAGVASPQLMALLGAAAVREQKLLEAKHRKTGNTGRTIRMAEVTADSVKTVVGGAGPFIERGTKPHIITPRAAKALAWAEGPSGGAFRRLSGRTRKGVTAANMVFAKRVKHPGTKADPFMVPGAKRALEGAGLAIGRAVVELWDHAA